MAAAKLSDEALLAFFQSHPELRERMGSIVGAVAIGLAISLLSQRFSGNTADLLLFAAMFVGQIAVVIFFLVEGLIVFAALRYRRKPTIITTNLDYDEWHNFLGNKPLVDALLSRLRQQCHTVKIDGPSLREPQS